MIRLFVLLIILVNFQSCIGLPVNKNRLLQAQKINDLAIMQLRANNLSAAKASFSLAYQLAPNSCSLDGLGAVAFYLKDYTLAQSYFQNAYALDNNYLNSLVNLAVVYELIGENSKAESLYQLLIQKIPENYRLHNNFAVYLFDNYPAEKQTIYDELLKAQVLEDAPLIRRNISKVKKFRFAIKD